MIKPQNLDHKTTKKMTLKPNFDPANQNLDLKNTIFQHYKPKYLQLLTKM